VSHSSVRTMKSKPLVTIIINNYNYAKFVGEAIESALAQTYDRVEVVVVDDGSTDASRGVIARYGDRIVAVMKENGGQASAFNAGFAASTGEIICFLDSDDLFLPAKVSEVADRFDRNPEIGWCFDPVQEFDSRSGERRAPSAITSTGKWDARAMTAAGKQPFVRTATSGLSFRTETLARILPMPEIIRITSDNYIKHVALGLKEGWMLSQALSLQRIHGDNAYTKRVEGKERLVGRTQLLTGLCLHERSSELRRLGRNVFCRGLGMLWANGGVDADCTRLVESFLPTLSLPERSKVLMRASYWGARGVIWH
jgi:glycosyltransferase involved in cell wall biosynthesis